MYCRQWVNLLYSFMTSSLVISVNVVWYKIGSNKGKLKYLFLWINVNEIIHKNFWTFSQILCNYYCKLLLTWMRNHKLLKTHLVCPLKCMHVCNDFVFITDFSCENYAFLSISFIECDLKKNCCSMVILCNPSVILPCLLFHNFSGHWIYHLFLLVWYHY